jgi:hypothetical protein
LPTFKDNLLTRDAEGNWQEHSCKEEHRRFIHFEVGESRPSKGEIKRLPRMYNLQIADRVRR